jgi:hypothetical protein
MSSDNKRTDEYWMGVRDALRMVDSFNKWAQRNPDRAKSLDDFIHDGLIAAAKRCESCLREKLGLSFVKSVHDEEATAVIDSKEMETTSLPDIDITLEDVPIEPAQGHPDSDFEVSIESKESGLADEVSIECEEPPLSMDTVERMEDETLEDLDIEGPQRDFSSDFELVEPSPLVVSSDEAKSGNTEIDASLDDSSLEEAEESFEPESEPDIDDMSPAFTWSDYEAAVSPTHEPEPPEPEFEEPGEAFDEYADESTMVDDALLEDVVEEPMPPPDTSKMWDTDDNATPPDEGGFSHSEPDIEESETKEEPVHFTEPPSPPPPPESDEDEEERKRRARRLFFGT